MDRPRQGPAPDVVIDEQLFRRTLGRFASGVTVVGAVAGDGTCRGMTASAFVSVSLRPPLVLVSVDLAAGMHALLEEAREYGVSILRDDQASVARYFARMAVDGDPPPPPFVAFGEAAVLDDCLASLTAEVVERRKTGDHTLFVGHVTRVGDASPSQRPLVYHASKFHSLHHPTPGFDLLRAYGSEGLDRHWG